MNLLSNFAKIGLSAAPMAFVFLNLTAAVQTSFADEDKGTIGLKSITTIEVPKETILFNRLKPISSVEGLSIPSEFSFYDMKRDSKNADILYENGQLRSNLVVGDISAIADLGAIHCKDVPNKYEDYNNKAGNTYPGVGHGGYPFKEDRAKDPWMWFSYSAAADLLNTQRTSIIKPIEGHCYALNRVSRDNRVTVIFKTEYLAENILYLSEIEVFARQKLTTDTSK